MIRNLFNNNGANNGLTALNDPRYVFVLALIIRIYFIIAVLILA